ncbi:hypothetical protein [Melittangium boletus]|uniref:hypothetical protein n=1 Tax=Melittangium boletus TaxID=83453 RepID=UPI003DA5B194
MKSLVLLTLTRLVGCVTGSMNVSPGPVGSAGGFPLPRRIPCDRPPPPEDWPEWAHQDAEALLGFLRTCVSLADYVAQQRRVDLPRLMEALDDWSAVRLGALGPVREDTSAILNRKRAAFLVSATERYGPPYAEVFALFVLHSAHDDEVDDILRRLARDKRLGQTLALMPTVREELKARGQPLSAYSDRGEAPGDVPRGLGRAVRDVLNTSPMIDGLRYAELATRRAQLPLPYQEALHEVERALARQHFAPGHVSVGSFDALTFGVPLGVYALVAGTGQGLSSLSQGQYEQATRELTPALLVAVYAGAGSRGARASRWEALLELGRWWEARLGASGVRELLAGIRSRREASFFVAEGGLDAALALREARGDVHKAPVWLSQAKPQRMNLSAGKGTAERLSALAEEGVGLSSDVLEARLALAERDALGARLSADVAMLERQRPAREAPPPGAGHNLRWGEYVTYWEQRLVELRQGRAVEGPLRWDAYDSMRGGFARGLEFERLMVEPRVETFSFKSRDLSHLGDKAVETRMIADARDALVYYGGALDIRRPSLRPILIEGRFVPVSRVRLIYEGGTFKPAKRRELQTLVNVVEKAVPDVEIAFQ